MVSEMEAGLGSYACPCLNVRIDLEKAESLTSNAQESSKAEVSASPNVVLDDQSRLQEEVLVSRSKTTIQINVTQPLLTSRSIIQSPAFTKGQSVTALICLICDTTVYAVNKVQQSGSSRSIGFATESNKGKGQVESLSKTESPSPIRAGSALPAEQDAILRPANGVGLMWIMSGCYFGSEAIKEISSSVNFSKSFAVVVADGVNSTTSTEATTSKVPQSTTSRMRSDSDTRRSSSPFRALPLQSSSARRSAASPSPARRRRPQPLAEQEEEQGDDLDTLHLLETLLPHLPSSVVKEKPHINGNSTSVRQLLTHTVQSSPDKLNTSQKQLEAKLDQIALGKLKEERDKAQREIFAMLKEKSNRLNHLERQLRNEARQLRQKYVTHYTSRSDQNQKQQKTFQSNEEGEGFDLDTSNENDKESSSPLFVRRRPLVPVGLEKSLSQDSDPNRRSGQIATSLGTSVISPRDQSGIYSGSMSSSQQGQTPHVGSLLSASFAMRGRDLPGQTEQQKQRSKEEEEDWFAHKKRLRERYPHADHSALPSAVNSDDEGAVQVKERTESANHSSEEEEEERRGRGRGRAPERGNNKTPTPPSKNASRNSAANDSSKGVQNAAKQDLAGVDQGMTTKRGALKGATTGSVTSNGVNIEKATVSAEKKVAFASTTEEVEVASNQHDSNPESKEPVEQGDPVFEIDEDMDPDDITPNASDISLEPGTTAIKESAKEVIERELNEEQVELQSNENSQYVGSVIQSLPVVGSFAAMTESESRGGRDFNSVQHNAIPRAEEEEEVFDPASLRFDGRTIYNADLSGSITRSTTHLDRTQIDKQDPSGKSLQMIAARQALFAGFPADDLQKSSIGFRVMVGEAEARLSGLLAPNAPSHRDLWSNKKRGKFSSMKYVLEGLAEEEDEVDDDNEIVQTKKENLEKAKSITMTPSAGAKEAADDLMLARSVPINVRNSFAGRSFSSIHRDPNSGFDLEPKTSLPYQEKKMTPSLLKATRQRQFGPTGSRLQRRPSLGTISDSSEKPASSEAGSGVQELVPGKPTDDQKTSDNRASVPIKSKLTSSATNPTSSRRGSIDLKYPVPSSITRGFDIGGSASPLPSVAKIAATAIDSTQSSPMLGSSSGTGRSSRVRSPRPPYVAPPPPESTKMRLSPDAAHRPREWKLAPAKEADKCDEDEEEGDLKNVLEFMHIIEKLKKNKRTGWYHHRIEKPESIADHMYRMAVLSMLLPDHNVDIGKCVQLCLVHDLAEALVGDITPLDKVTKEEKLFREKEAIEHLVNGLLASSKAGKRIETLWNEYEDRKTIESKIVKDLDRFELALQGVEYERDHQTADLQPFYDQSVQIQHPRIQRWIRALAKEREELWKDSPYGYVQTFPKDEVALTSWASNQD
ncbi:hypothetical protein L7F22_043734 [Adiantum nelumboides]|nr:hypothetical protein [Adiantum nelumboides]